MSDHAPEPLDYSGFLIRRAQQAHVAAWQDHVSSQISSVQFGVLAVLFRRPGLSQRDLCDELDLDRSTIAELLGRLERHGLVDRSRHAADRRRNTLRLTARGAAELERLRPRVDRVEHVLTDALSAAERSELRRLLGIVLASARADEVPSAAAI
jgi:DNA-binding MarR family transcriptional regulator